MLQRLDAGREEEVVDVLVESFWDYPVMRYTLSEDTGDDYDDKLRSLIGFFAARRFRQGQPVFGIEADDALVAAALVDEPRGDDHEISIGHLVEKVQTNIGEEAWGRLVRFGDALDPLEPKVPHYYVGMIGVRPAYQGRGLARVILDHVAGLSAGHRSSEAVCLTTETPANVAFYEHLGYEVFGEAQVDDLHSWSLINRTG